MKLLWRPENIPYGVGWMACRDNIEVHIFKTKKSNCYHYRILHITPRGERCEAYNSARKNPQAGAQDYRVAQENAEMWISLHQGRR